MIELVYPTSGLRVFHDPDDSKCEMLPVVDPTGLVIAQASRRLCHGKPLLLHPVVHLNVVDSQGRIFLQKRSANCKLFPGLWDTAVGGHVTFGEYLMEALRREAYEEIGLVDFYPQPVASYIYEDKYNKELVCSYATLGEFKLTPDSTEVEDGRFWTTEEIVNNLRKGVFTPNFEEDYIRTAPILQSLL